MRDLITDVFLFLETGKLDSVWITNELGSKKEVLHPDFENEMYLQMQIQETETDA